MQLTMKPSSVKSKTVVIIEDQTAIRELVSEMLQAKGKFRVVGTSADGSAGVEMALRLKPDILILDILLPDISGVEVLHRLRNTIPGLSVLVFSGKSEKQLARGLVKEGVRGYVNKNSPLSELRKAMDAIADGQTWFSAEFNEAVMTALKNSESSIDQMAVTLTSREREVAVLLAKSNSSKEVAARLNISTKTAENHRTNLMRTLNNCFQWINSS